MSEIIFLAFYLLNIDKYFDIILVNMEENMPKNKMLKDEKIEKSLLNLEYLAYVFLICVTTIGFGVTTYFGYKFYIDKTMALAGIILWEIIFYTITIMIILGIKDVLKLLRNLKTGNIFTFENANILKTIDKKLIFTLLFSLIANIIMVILNWNSIALLAIWIVFISFILAGHILVNPLAFLVERSAEMQIEMDLTI